ncbi:MAG TPA: hypothetical protein DDZ88_16435 [Verrucomicrobiales bacterium]|nr:hypothetical protein [Verrucomicrobiales bacterium]
MTLSAILKAKQRRQTGVVGITGKEGGKEQLQPGTIVISGTSYLAAVHLGKVEYRMETASGLWKRLQPLTATVRKTLLATAPEKQSIITFGGLKFQIDDVAGHNANDLVWTLKAERKLPSPS